MRFLGLFIMAVAIISAAGKRHARIQREQSDSFWERERAANFTRKKDISGLPYISIPLEKFPIGNHKNEKLAEYETILTQLSGAKILNLGSRTNTDLKLAYGAANLPILSECDQNFATLCTTLASYGECLLELGYEDEARNVLEFGIDCGSDISKNYMLLGTLYRKKGLFSEFDRLKTCAERLDSIMKQPILAHLEKLSA